jgi:uncharacterized membrane protein
MKKPIKEIIQIIFKYSLAIAIVYGFFYILGNMTKFVIPEGSRDIVMLVIGVIVGKFGTIVDHEWGSSSGSEKKTDIIAEDKQNGNGTP